MGVVFFDSGENVVFICFFCFFLNGRLGKLQGQVPEVTEPGNEAKRQPCFDLRSENAHTVRLIQKFLHVYLTNLSLQTQI